MDRSVAMDVGCAIGELIAINWCVRDGGWTEYIQLRVIIDISEPLCRVVQFVNREGVTTVYAIKYERLPTFCYNCGLISHSTQKYEKTVSKNKSNETSYQYGNWLRASIGIANQDWGNWRNGIEVIEAKRIVVSGGWQSALPRSMKFLCWNCRGLRNPATVRELKQLLVANNLDIIFLSEIKMIANDFQRVQNRCKMENGLAVSSEGKSGGLTLIWREDVDVNIQNYSKRGLNFKGDFNAILNDAEKEGGRRKARSQINEFKDLVDELALVDIKPGRKPKMQNVDPRLSFKFDVCWATDVEAKNIIKGV
ncbi:hypothetical protein Goklo_029793 [Gossypium klotzschianum]|uniref:Zinc knuckle CX2CX4HX4C domain-containing protein n=1 Tax=Gossypium klotzschianum TaxID=34286 RepID=A0A7J8W7L3_9ROSI|nr:hypothetical protein [Gossypium klotzschianum]